MPYHMTQSCGLNWEISKLCLPTTITLNSLFIVLWYKMLCELLSGWYHGQATHRAHFPLTVHISHLPCTFPGRILKIGVEHLHRDSC